MSPRTRGILVGVMALFAVLFSYSSFFEERTRLASDWIPDQGLNLGLDLRGGIHWLLSIDEEKALRDELSNLAGRVRDVADDEKLVYDSIDFDEEAGTQIDVRGASETDLRALIEESFDTLQLGTDGGALALTLTDDWKEQVVERGVQQAVVVLTRRIDAWGVTEPKIAPEGRDRILVQMPGKVDPRRAREIIEKTTFLEFKKVLAFAPNEELLSDQYPGGFPEDTEVVVARTNGIVSEAYLVQNPAILTGDMLEDARLQFDRRNRPIVGFTWDSQGTELFREFTAANIDERMAAIIDEDVITAPVIRSRIGRRGQIEGTFSQQEAADLAVQLRSGSLPIPLVIEEERTVGPSLGADSIASGVRSILIGALAVLAFMAIYYSVSGVLANVALVLNLLIIIGAMSAFQATLTLPGLAGIVLTVGIAVDANVIIFERIREELRSGKALRNAIQIGFKRSTLTILDANITTMIAAVVLLYFGRGPVQGFGVTLAIGIFSSVFCALLATRLLVDLVAQRSQKLRI